MEFTDEFQLTEKPLQIDCTVVKVKKDCKIKNEIGKIFRKHNIFEYKSPKDELNIDTFYKAVAYACLYKVLPNHVNEIPAEEITITLIRDRKPVKLMQELEKSGYECKKETAGIYYIYSVMFPVQIIVSSELDTDMHVQLKSIDGSSGRNIDETVFVRSQCICGKGEESYGCCAAGYCKQ